MVFDLAIKENLIKYNPCELIELPKAKKYEAKFCDRDDINNISVTADVYGHLDLSRKRMLSDKMSFEVGG